MNGASFPELKIGDSNQLKVGEPVLAIGSPFGFDYSASAGIVSAKSRNMSGETWFHLFRPMQPKPRQTGSGPLFNQRGEVVQTRVSLVVRVVIWACLSLSQLMWRWMLCSS